MGDMLGNTLSALTSYQRALATTSHNIANANTEGYSRQRVDFATRIPSQQGSLSIGSGVKVSQIDRAYDEFAAVQLRTSTSGFGQAQSYYQLSAQLDNTLAATDTGIHSSLARFYTSLQDVADDPGSISARQLLLAEANGLSDRVAGLNAELNSLESEVDLRIKSSVSDINDLAKSIADINVLISEAQGKFGTAANDLLDQRDRALGQLNEIIGTQNVEQSDGSMSVFIGSGEALVLAGESVPLAATRSAFDSTRFEVSIQRGGALVDLSGSISGGSLGGALAFRDGLLSETRNELGRITLAIAETLNSQNRDGLDLQGNQGGDIFSTSDAVAITNTSNAGVAVASATITDLSAVSGDNILLRYDGAAWQFFSPETGAPLAGVTGTGTALDPFAYEGVEVTVTGAAVAGDEVLVLPTANAAANLSVILTDPAGIAAAAATRSLTDSANTGSAQISATDVIDSSDPNLFNDAEISFLDANTYQIDGAGSFAYVSGSDIDINGSRVIITGSPAAGDIFNIEANFGGVGDNRNAVKLAATESLKFLNNGSVSVQDSVSGLIGDVGVATRSAEINLQSQENVLNQQIARQQEVSGVNLDEEAANLLRFQQAYQAAAQATSIANDLFQNLMSAFR